MTDKINYDSDIQALKNEISNWSKEIYVIRSRMDSVYRDIAMLQKSLDELANPSVHYEVVKIKKT